jgi:hypothetical protein
MAAPDFSAVTALSNKAVELKYMGHFARAATKFGQALELALAQGTGPDCLIVARLQLEHVMCACLLADPDSVTDAHFAARRATELARCLAAAATLRRRKAAGTLLGATCTAAELAWYRHTLEHVVKMDDLAIRAEIPRLALLFGHDTVLSGRLSRLASRFRLRGSTRAGEWDRAC